MYNKSDMKYDDYKWTVYGNDDPKITGDPDQTFFSRKEGYEVLYLINKLFDKWNFKDNNSYKKMEIMIHESLPGEMRSQENVMKWIAKNWKEYNV